MPGAKAGCWKTCFLKQTDLLQSRLLEDLLLEADQALYEVKRENKGLFKEYDADKCQEA